MRFINIALSALALCATAVAQRASGGGGSVQAGGGPTSVTPGANPTSNPSFAQFLAFLLSLQAGNGGDSGRPQRRDASPLDARQEVKGASAGSWEAPQADLSGQLQDIIKWIWSQPQFQQTSSAGYANSENAGGSSKLARRQEWQEWEGMNSAAAAQDLQNRINELMAEINRAQEEYQQQHTSQDANYAASDVAAAGMWGKLARRQDWAGMSSAMSSQQLQNAINELWNNFNSGQEQHSQQMQQTGASYANAEAAGNAWSKLARRQFNLGPNLDPNSPQTQELQAQIAAIQAVDKALEMEMKRIDTQRDAVQTEVDNVAKILGANVSNTFNLMGRRQGEEAIAMRVRRQRYARNV